MLVAPLACDSHKPSDRGVVHTFVGDRRIPRIPRRARTAEVVADRVPLGQSNRSDANVTSPAIPRRSRRDHWHPEPHVVRGRRPDRIGSARAFASRADRSRASHILFGGAGLVTVPEGVRLLQESLIAPESQPLDSLGLASGALVWGVVLLPFSRRHRSALLGRNWDGARSVLLPLSIAMVAIGLAYGAMAGLRSLAAAKRSLRARCIDALAIITCALIGASVADAEGAAWGLAAAGCLRIPTAWWQFSRALREHGETSHRANAPPRSELA